jgi:cytochrome P450
MLKDVRRMLGDPLGYLEATAARYGPVVVFPLPKHPAVLLTDPALVHQVLVAGHRATTKRTIQYDTLATVTGQGLLVSDPPRWTRRRQALQPSFHHERLAGVAEHTVRAATAVAERWRAAGTTTIDVDEAMMAAALEVVGAALFSADLRRDAGAIVDAVLVALDRVVARARSPWLPPAGVPTPGNRRLARALATIDGTVAAMVAERRARGDLGDDLLGMLLAMSADDDTTAVRDEAVTLLIAGHETVASALTWAWWLLATHPDAQDRLHAEVDALPGPPGFADLRRLPFARAVVDEALRLYPPAWVISRRAAAEQVLGGYTVPAGATLLVSTWALHRHPAWWAEPAAFRPERWLEDASGGAPRWAYVPFGAGPRLCIGRDFALVEATLLLAELARHWAVAPVPGPPPQVDALVTLRPRGGLPLRLIPRPQRQIPDPRHQDPAGG